MRPDSMFANFRQRFWLPPRPHGQVIEDRTVSFLELFYDLVYVVVIGRAAHSLAEHISWRGLGEFTVIFGLIWVAWLNGTLIYELHGREDGRTRFFVFTQMVLLALLAVFTGDAASGSGAQFAVVYTLYLAVVWWLWYTVRRQDTDEYRAATGRFLTSLAVSIGLMAVSVVASDGARLIVWAFLLAVWLGSALLLSRDEALDTGVTATDSMVERFGLFVIIVLGEVIVGVVAGLSEAERNAQSIATGLIGLCIGFAYWWTYFDFVGRRLPIDTGRIRTRWMFLHMPVTLSIAAAGAAMVSLIEHASEARTPAVTAWLLAGSVAVGLASLVAKMRTLRDFKRLPGVFRPLSNVMLTFAGLALVTAVWAPAPWVLALSLVIILLGVWLYAVDRWLRLPNPDSIRPQYE